MKCLTAIAILSSLLVVGCATKNEQAVTPNQVCAGHGGVKSFGDKWSRDNIGWNGNQPNWYTAVLCRDGFLGTAVNWHVEGAVQ